MSSDRDLRHIVRSWLRTDEHESADHVLAAVLDRLDLTPQRRPSWVARRFPIMNSTTFRFGMAGSAVVVLLLVGTQLLPTSNTGVPGGSATPSATPDATPITAETAQLPSRGKLDPGTYVAWSPPFPLEVTFSVDTGWHPWTPGTITDGFAIFKHSPDPPRGVGIIVNTVDNLYADPCEPGRGKLDPPVGPSTRDLAEALAEQSSQAGIDVPAIEPVDLSGHAGHYLEYANAPVSRCGTLHRWSITGANRIALPAERDFVWIVDVDGTRIVVDVFAFPETTETDLEEAIEIVEAMDISARSEP